MAATAQGQRKRPRRRGLGWILAALIVVVGIGGTALLLSLGGDARRSEGSAAKEPETEPLRPVELYYGMALRPDLTSEIRWIPTASATEDWIVEVVGALIDGSRRGSVASIPGETVLLDVFLDGLGGAYLNFSGAVRTLHPEGDSMEWLTIRSLVATVTQNVPAVERVWVLVDGAQEAPLVSQVSLNRPYTWEDVNP